MIHRYVFLKLHDTWATQAGRAEVGGALGSLLRSLAEVRAVSVEQANEAACPWDLCVRVSFDGPDELSVYLADSVHAAFVSSYLNPRTASRQVWSFLDQAAGEQLLGVRPTSASGQRTDS
jgi:hypothetical protein